MNKGLYKFLLMIVLNLLKYIKKNVWKLKKRRKLFIVLLEGLVCIFVCFMLVFMKYVIVFGKKCFFSFFLFVKVVWYGGLGMGFRG